MFFLSFCHYIYSIGKPHRKKLEKKLVTTVSSTSHRNALCIVKSKQPVMGQRVSGSGEKKRLSRAAYPGCNCSVTEGAAEPCLALPTFPLDTFAPSGSTSSCLPRPYFCPKLCYNREHISFIMGHACLRGEKRLLGSLL